MYQKLYFGQTGGLMVKCIKGDDKYKGGYFLKEVKK